MDIYGLLHGFNLCWPLLWVRLQNNSVCSFRRSKWNNNNWNKDVGRKRVISKLSLYILWYINTRKYKDNDLIPGLFSKHKLCFTEKVCLSARRSKFGASRTQVNIPIEIVYDQILRSSFYLIGSGISWSCSYRISNILNVCQGLLLRKCHFCPGLTSTLQLCMSYTGTYCYGNW